MARAPPSRRLARVSAERPCTKSDSMSKSEGCRVRRVTGRPVTGWKDSAMSSGIRRPRLAADAEEAADAGEEVLRDLGHGRLDGGAAHLLEAAAARADDAGDLV